MHKRNGTATLSVSVPGPGVLALDCHGCERVVKRPDASGSVTLQVTPTGALAQALRKHGKATIVVRVRFVPAGGRPATQTRSVTLVEK